MEKPYRKDADLADKQGLALRTYHEAKVAKLIEKMPMTKWSGTSKGLIEFTDGVFAPQLDVAKEHERILFEWVREICEYRLHSYFERKGKGS